MVAFLVDTNVLIYPYDPRDRAKQERAQVVVDRLITAEQGAVSVQCLSEFYSVATRKLPEPLSGPEALARVERFCRTFTVLPLTASIALEGCRGATERQLAIWDALIWAIAKLNEVPYVLSEDFEHDRFLEGVRFLNPFAPSFDLDLLPATP